MFTSIAPYSIMLYSFIGSTAASSGNHYQPKDAGMSIPLPYLLPVFNRVSWNASRGRCHP